MTSELFRLVANCKAAPVNSSTDEAMAHAWASAMHTRFTRSGVAYAVRSTAKAQPTSPTVLFAHGTGLAKEIWHPVQRRLEDADYHGVGCDHDRYIRKVREPPRPGYVRTPREEQRVAVAHVASGRFHSSGVVGVSVSYCTEIFGLNHAPFDPSYG